MMKPLRILALVALATPAAALAQAYYAPRDAHPLAREELARCMDHDERLGSRHAQLEAEARMNEREGTSIARANVTLAENLRRLDPADVAAVAAHNARAEEHNRRVEAHNLRVADQNAAARDLNRDRSDFSLGCGARSYYPRDRDAILYERGALR